MKVKALGSFETSVTAYLSTCLETLEHLNFGSDLLSLE